MKLAYFHSNIRLCTCMKSFEIMKIAFEKAILDFKLVSTNS